jgi:hypothetical protein
MDKDQAMNSDVPFATGTADAAPTDLSHIEAINNLDTARLALRWALERMQSLQMLKEQAERKAAEAATARLLSDQDRKDLQRVMELRKQEDNQHAAYYAKLESYLAQHFAGKLDLVALIKRETQTAELEALLQDRQLNLEKEYAARRERLETEFNQAKFEAAQTADERVAQAKTSVLQSRQNLERSFTVKLTELTDKEVRLKAEAEALAQRQAQFDAFSREQRARLELDIKSFHDSVQDQMKFRIDSAERFLTDRHGSAASAWDRQKTELLKEVDEAREQALAYLPRMTELDRRLVAAQEEAGRVKTESESQIRHLQAAIHSLQIERTALSEEVARLRQQREIDLGRVLDLERQTAQSDEDCNRFSVMLLQEKTRARELQDELKRRESEWAGAEEALKKDKRELMEAAAKRVSDADALETLLLGRFQDLEDEIHKRDLSWKEREEALRTRDRDWHTRLSEWQTELNRKAEQLEMLKAHLLDTIKSYKTRVGPADILPG